MGKLTHLLKWKRTINLKDEKGLSLKDEEGNPVIVYMRVVGDKDLEDAAFRARFASANMRTKLFTEGTDERVALVDMFGDASRELATQMILQGHGAGWTGEALSAVEIPDLPTIAEVARDPDSPTLEELEKLDKLIKEVDDEHRKKLEEYIKTKQDVLLAELQEKSLEELREMAKDAVVVVTAIETYLNELLDEKVWRSVYQDDKYTLPEFKSLDEFRNLSGHIKTQLREEYQSLEAGLDNAKN